jgi:hypothetical protein
MTDAFIVAGMLIVYSAILVSWFERRLARVWRSLARIEQRLESVVAHLDVQPAGSDLVGVYELLRQGRKIAAVKLYCQLTGSGLAEAKRAVERILSGDDRM